MTHRPAETLDTLAILKGETAETGVTLDEREKDDETNPISHNPLGINALPEASRTEFVAAFCYCGERILACCVAIPGDIEYCSCARSQPAASR